MAEAPSGRPSTLARSLAAGLVTLGGAAYASGSGTVAAVGGVLAAAGSAAAVPYAEELSALVAAELRGKPQLLADGILAGARGVRPEITEEELSLELVQDDELRALMFRVLEAGRRTARPDKLQWLGEILGQSPSTRSTSTMDASSSQPSTTWRSPRSLSCRRLAGRRRCRHVAGWSPN
jgi:hypothetical protein